jgi:SAM-dependent methyltransferase
LSAETFDLRAIDEAQRILGGASRYNQLIYEEYRSFLGDRVIEIGTAAGNNASYLLDRQLLLLTDNDPRYVSLLREKFGQRENVKVAELDVSMPPNGELKPLLGTFDTVISLNVIEHIEDDDEALRHMCGWLRPGGSGIFIVPALRALYGSLDMAAGHFRRYSPSGFASKLRTVGFDVHRCEYFNPIAVPGWWLSSRILRRTVIPRRQVALADRLTFLIRWLRPLALPFGISILALVRRQ